MNKKVYYAHFMGIYNTPQEERDIKTLVDLGLDVVNPNQPGTQGLVDKALAKYKRLMSTTPYVDMFYDVFLSQVRECEVFAFKALPDGKIPSGCVMELEYAIENGKTIIELPSGISSRKMNKEETKDYLLDIGQR